MESPPSGSIDVSSLSNTLKTWRRHLQILCLRGRHTTVCRYHRSRKLWRPRFVRFRGSHRHCVHSGMGGRSFGSCKLGFPSVTPLGRGQGEGLVTDTRIPGRTLSCRPANKSVAYQEPESAFWLSLSGCEGWLCVKLSKLLRLLEPQFPDL